MIRWDNKEKDSLWLFTIAEYEKLPDGVKLESIVGKTVVKGLDYIDLDVRFGHIAFGVRNPWEHELKHQFLLFGLAQ